MKQKNGRRFLSAIGIMSILLPAAAVPVFAEPDSDTTAPAAEPAQTEETTAAAETAVTEIPTTTSATTTTRDILESLTYEELDDGTLRITSFYWTDEDVVTIPDTIDGKAITEIGSFAFQYCYADAVNLPASLRSIGENAFTGNAYLQSVTIPDGCTSIGYCAFSECDVLNTVVIPESVTYIGYMAFDMTPFYVYHPDDFIVLGGGVLYAYRGSETADLVIPDNVKIIGPYACSDHNEITSVTIPDSVTTIYDCAFDNCTNLTAFTAPATFEKVDGAAFVNTAWYHASEEDFLILGDYLIGYRGEETEITVPDGIRVVNDSAFEGNAAITTLILPDSVEIVGRAACYRCTSLQVVTFGEHVQSIGDLAFYGCNTLRYLRLGHQLQTIGNLAFAGCADLEEVYLPDTLTSIGSKAFGYQWNLENSLYEKSETALTLYANAEAARTYAEAENIKLEPLPEAENTDPIPDITTTQTTALNSAVETEKDRSWIPAALLGGGLVVIGCVAWIIGKHKKKS